MKRDRSSQLDEGLARPPALEAHAMRMVGEGTAPEPSRAGACPPIAGSELPHGKRTRTSQIVVARQDACALDTDDGLHLFIETISAQLAQLDPPPQLGDTLVETAIRHGQLGAVQWAHANGCCPWDSSTIVDAIHSGQLAVLQWLLANGCPHKPKGISSTCFHAAWAGHLEVLKWLCVEQGFHMDSNWLLKIAQEHGHVALCQWIEANRILDSYSWASILAIGQRRRAAEGVARKKWKSSRAYIGRCRVDCGCALALGPVSLIALSVARTTAASRHAPLAFAPMAMTGGDRRKTSIRWRLGPWPSCTPNQHVPVQNSMSVSVL
jgi:hypothetical protein